MTESATIILFDRVSRKTGKLLAEWESEIVARENLDAMCLKSKLANMMYPELPMARDREAKLLEEGGEFIARLLAKADEIVDRNDRQFPRA